MKEHANISADGTMSSKSTAAKKTSGKEKPAERSAEKPVKLLAGGNPQIPKGDGDAPVQAYLDAIPPGWKQQLAQQIDSVIKRAAPKAQKAVRWNSPFYGIEGNGWFVSFHVFTRYIKVTFFTGTSLEPVPQGGTPKSKEVRWVDIYEGSFDEAQLESWVKQAARLPGWKQTKSS